MADADLIFKPPPIRIDAFESPPPEPLAIEWWIGDYNLQEETDRMGEGVKVCVIDTGIDQTHATSGVLKGAIVDARDFTNSPNGIRDMVFHGTACASVIGGRGKLQGVAPRCLIYVAKGLGDSGGGDDRGLIAAIKWGVAQGCHIISNSWGSPLPSQALAQAVRDAEAAGVAMLFAAGNSGPDATDYPGAQEEVIALGALDRVKKLADFSNTGTYVDTVAPGVKMRMASLNGGYREASGTSFACPWFAGLLARRYSMELAAYGEIRTKGHEAINALLEKTCDDLGTAGRDPEYGYGVAKPKSFLEVVPPPPPPGEPGEPIIDVSVGPLRFRLPGPAGGLTVTFANAETEAATIEALRGL